MEDTKNIEITVLIFSQGFFIRLPKIFNELAIAYGEGIFLKVIKSRREIELLILDDFL